MISLDDKIWKELTSGYKILYDVSPVLKRLEMTNDPSTEDEIWKELWEELHHQGDIGTASYLAIPHLIRIAKTKERVDFNIFGLFSTIEIQRHVDGNPEIPSEFRTEYLDSLKEIVDLVQIIKNDNWDNTLTSCVLSAIAVSKGQIKLGKILLDLEDPDMIDSLEEFLENH